MVGVCVVGSCRLHCVLLIFVLLCRTARGDDGGGRRACPTLSPPAPPVRGAPHATCLTLHPRRGWARRMHQCSAGCARVHAAQSCGVARGVERARNQGWMDATDGDGWTRLREWVASVPHAGAAHWPVLLSRRPASASPCRRGCRVQYSTVRCPTRLVWPGEQMQTCARGRVFLLSSLWLHAAYSVLHRLRHGAKHSRILVMLSRTRRSCFRITRVNHQPID